MPEPIRLRALPVSELVDQTVALYRRRFAVFAGMALLLAIPALATALLSGAYRSLDPILALLQSGGGRGVVAQPQYNGLLVALSYVIGVVMAPLGGYSLLAAPALVAVAIDVAHGRDATLGGALLAALRRYWALLGMAILFTLALATFCAFPLGVWVFVGWAVAVPVLLEERTSIGGALGRSWNLVRDNWWHSFFTLLLAWGLGIAVEAALLSLVGALVFLVPSLPHDARDAILVAADQLVGVAVRPLLPIAAALLYYDLRVRHEALDLDQLAATVSAVPVPARG